MKSVNLFNENALNKAMISGNIFLFNRGLYMSEEKSDYVKGLEAQLNATKQMFNESMASNLQLRSTMILLQQNLQDSYVKNTELTKKLVELEAPKSE